MPKEQKKRGRRAQQKRKEELESAGAAAPPPPEPFPDPAAAAADYIGFGDAGTDAGVRDDETVFYGLLTEEEQEYFRRADEMLELNSFADPEEKEMLVANVYKEAEGKELKLANSQGCSRLMERLILLSTPAQLKALFQKFMGHFMNLVQHRFASHCCETLFVQCAGVVARESDPDYTPPESETSGADVFSTMETLFLYMLNELEPHLKLLLSHTFASHAIRTLLLILSGKPVSSAATLVRSKKKENITLDEPAAAAAAGEVYAVPPSFHEAGRKIVAATTGAFTLEELLALAVHPIGSPTLQILIQLEMGLSKKERRAREKAGALSLLQMLTGISDEQDAEKEGSSTSFFQNLLYDPVGSHLAESMMRYAPNKDFKKLYVKYFQHRMGNLARNETAAFVVQQVLERLGKEELEEAVVEIVPQVRSLVGRSRVAVIKTLIDCCAKNEVDNAGEVREAIVAAYDASTTELIFKMLNIKPEDLNKDGGENRPKAKRDPSHLHGSLLAQSMLNLPGEFNSLITDSLLAQSPTTLAGLSKHPQASHVVQAVLRSQHALPHHKRKLLQALRGHFAPLALDPAGSHIVDACWDAAPTNLRQAIADELLTAEPALRESYSGRNVWRNWAMDKYKTRRRDWFALGKSEEGAKEGKGKGERKKTAIELARERHAAKKAGSEGTGANKRARTEQDGREDKRKRHW